MSLDSMFSGIKHGIEDTGRRIKKDFDNDTDQIGKGFKDHGIIGGVLETGDVFSPGHQGVNRLDELGLFTYVGEDETMKQLVSAGINAAAMNPIALKDLADAYGAYQRDHANQPAAPAQSGGSSGAAPSQGAEDPQVVYTTQPIHRGYDVDFNGSISVDGSSGGCMSGSVDFNVSGSQQDRLREAIERMRKRRGAEGGDDEILRKIKALLANHSLCFEDMIYELLRLVLKDSQSQSRKKLEAFQSQHVDSQARSQQLQGKLDDAQTKLNNTEPGTKEFVAAQGDVEKARNNLNNFSQTAADSRADLFEDLKQLMQKVSEMEQTLSNIMNTMHESSMAAIRNIR